MAIIRQLDEQTANMIAAGEVVERPMGVVKELVENSIDAGAKRITVSVEEGGIASLTVSDDGCGMDSKDAVNAFLRHATSKIRSSEDLWDIGTLGFRGEALPSIASVSKLTLVTSDGTDCTKVVIEYGKTVSVSAWPCNQGTEITVENLFYRTPARLKHLRSGAYENSLVQDVIMKFAMSHPEIAFRFVSSGKEAFRTTGSGDLKEVIFQCWGREAAEAAIPVSFSDFDYQVSGYLVKPNITRASRNFMHIFLNGRMVKTYRLYQSVMDGYEDFIVKGRKPLCVLNIRMDPHLLDVNVHPSKWEVRISKENQLEYLLKDNVREALKNTMLAPNIRPSRESVQYEQIPLETNLTFHKPFVSAPEPQANVTPAPEMEPAFIPDVPHVKPEPVRTEPEVPEVTETPVTLTEPEPVVQKLPEMQVIGQLHEKFILCACEAGLAVIDQHAAQERVHYEEYCRALNQNPVMLDCLVPLTLAAGDDLVRRIDELNAAAADLHITFEPFGHDTLLVRSIPAWMKDLEEEPFLQDVLDNFRNERKSSYTRMEKKKIATMACHHSIRFNRALTMQEMNEVVRQLNDCENPYHCPHGRPTFVILDEKDLAKEFLR
ncbi:MAG: DNA mismatch repair endonuclease MutL [Solobacterium sp.]|nr:DNA mismatch repair endonuclease MutL [Solobacterium sp.]